MTVLAQLPAVLGIPAEFIVAAIGAAFLLLQLYNCARVWRRMKRHNRNLAKLISDMDNEGDGRGIEAFVGDIPWLKWVDENFPRDSAAPANYTRDDVLKELDTQIGADGNYLLLQRAGVMAPLLGVIITVVGFIFLLPATAGLSEEMGMGDILYMVTPLVAGVGIGAALAFINQWLLHLVGVRVEAVRDSARTWFDAAIWRDLGLDVQAATVKTIAAMQRMGNAVLKSAQQQEQNARALRKSISKIYQSSDTFQQTYEAFGQELGELPKTLAELTDTTKAAVETIGSLIPVGERAVLGMDVSVSAFSNAVEKQFVEAAKTHQGTIEGIAESVGRINESTLQLKVSSGDLQETVNAHTNAFKTLNRSLQKQVLPAHEGFLAAISKFSGQAEGLLERLDSLHTEVIASIEKMTSLAPEASEAITKFAGSAEAFTDVVQNKFAVAADKHSENTDKLAESVSGLQVSADGLTQGGVAVEGLLKLHTELGRELEATGGSLRQAIEHLAETGASLRQSMASEVAPSQRSMHAAADSFSGSAQRLAAFVEQGLDPVTERLTKMDETFANLAGTVEAIQDFTNVRQDINHLSQALSQAATVAESIAALPEQIRTVLEGVAEAQRQQALANSKGSMMTWLRGR
ncbi:MAG: hypothetical protein ISR77_00785 [Pirellulaceae bacterium]|nr:hypothetical protein [Pirellulaceae bacterium]